MKQAVYIAGKMTGLPDLNRKAFMDAEQYLEGLGFVVLNPARLPDGLPPDRYMPLCIAMVQAADFVFMLTGWELSPGAIVERQYAMYQKKTILYETEGTLSEVTE